MKLLANSWCLFKHSESRLFSDILYHFALKTWKHHTNWTNKPRHRAKERSERKIVFFLCSLQQMMFLSFNLYICLMLQMWMVLRVRLLIRYRTVAMSRIIICGKCAVGLAPHSIDLLRFSSFFKFQFMSFIGSMQLKSCNYTLFEAQLILRNYWNSSQQMKV